MAQALHERGLNVAIWGISTPEVGARPATEAPVRSLGLAKYASRRDTTRQLAEELAADPPDVLHIHSYTTHVHGVKAAQQVGIKRVLVSFHDFRLGLHRIATCRRLREGVDRVIVLNETMRELYQRQCGYRPEQMVVLPNAVDTRRFSPRPPDPALAAACGLGPEHYVIGAVGGLNPNKGHRYLVEAFAAVHGRLPQTRLLLVGDGRDRAYLEARVARLGIAEAVIFAGRRHDLPAWLSLFDLYVQPSRIESDPLAMHEAMAMGLPVVSTNRGGLPELLGWGDAGLLVPPEQPGPLAEAILGLAQDTALARDFGETARRLSVEKYDLQQYEDKLWRLYEEMLVGVA